MSKPLPWSFSSLTKFTTCPYQYYETRVLGNFKDEPGEVAIWGLYVHKCIEDFIRDEIPLPENVKTYYPQIQRALYHQLTPITEPEIKLAVDSTIAPCDWANRWAGSISDVLKIADDTAWVVDWKLGKVKPSAQLKLNALMVFYNYPEVNTVHTSFEWLQFKQRTEDVHTRDQIPELWSVFMKDLQQYAQAFKTDTWQMRPSGLCFGWCPCDTCPNWRPKK